MIAELYAMCMGFPGGSDRKEYTYSAGEFGFDPWVGKIPGRRAWQLTPVFLPGESSWIVEPGRLHPQGRKELDPTERLGIAQQAVCIFTVTRNCQCF